MSFVPLPLWECLFYLLMSISHALYGIITAYYESQNLELPEGETLFGFPKDTSFGFPKDTSNNEWANWTFKLPQTIQCLMAHSLVFNLGSRLLSPSDNRAVCLVFWSVLHLLLYPITTIVECIVFAVICLLTAHKMKQIQYTRSKLIGKVLIWTYTLIWLYLINNVTVHFEKGDWDCTLLKAYKLFQIVSYCLTLLDESQSFPSINICFLELAAYCLYWPTTTILIVPYQSFRQQMASRQLQMSMTDLIKLTLMAMRIAFWTVLAEVSTAFLYQAAYMHHPELMEEEFTNAWQFFGIAYASSQFFHMMYMSIFGIPALFAAIDGLWTTSFPPICTAHVSLFSVTWRYFDRGLYAFLSTHLFRPISRISDQLGIKYSILGRLVAGALTFYFVYLWHGASKAYFYWVLLNMLAFALELFGKAFYNHFTLHTRLSLHFSQQNIRRLICLCHVPCLFISFVAITYFFGTHNGATGNLIFKAFLTDRLFSFTWSGIYSVFFLYCHAQTCLELQERVGFR